MKLGFALLVMAWVTAVCAQTESARETWSGIGVGINVNGMLVGDRCSGNPYNVSSIEFPIGSEVNFTYGGFWFGALIEENGSFIPRVSTATDGWQNPPIVELHPDYDSDQWLIELANQDTSYDLPYCTIEPLVDYYTRADHEFSVTYFDTLTDRLFVPNDQTDGRHRPLGLKVEMTTYAFLDFCRRVVWIRLRVTNVGLHDLRNLWCGFLAHSDVWHDSYGDLTGCVGFEPENDFAYFFSQTGRTDSSGDELLSSASIGIMPLVNPSFQAVSFNWWLPFNDIALNFGPAWESYADRDSLGMGWTRLSGTAQGDRQRYQVMTNREQDYDPLRFCDPEWIAAHTPPNQRWSTPTIDCGTMQDALRQSPYCLTSSGPHGRNRDGYVTLDRGDSTDIWFAVFGGQGFQSHEQPMPPFDVDPDLYDLADLLDRADVAKNSPCFSWLDAEEPSSPVIADGFELAAPYPNPFNGEVRIEFRTPLGTSSEVDLVNILGQRVTTLFSGRVNGANQVVTWRPERVSSGVYFVRLLSDNTIMAMQKLMYVK